MFNTRLHACVRNLEADYEAVRRHRDQLLVELQEAKQLLQEKGSVHASVQKLMLEIQQLRLENSDVRDRELRLSEEAARLKREQAGRGDYDKVVETARQLAARVEELEQQQKYYGDVSLRAAQYQAQYNELKAESEKLRKEQARWEEERSSVQGALEDLRKTHQQLVIQSAGMEAELAGARAGKQSADSLAQTVEKLKSELSDTSLELRKVKSMYQGQESLVTILHEQLADKVGQRGEMDRITRANEALRSQLDALERERALQEKLARERLEEVSVLTRAKTDLAAQLEAALKGRADDFAKEAGALRAETASLQTQLALAQEGERTVRAQLELARAQLAGGAGVGAVDSGAVARERDSLLGQVKELQDKLGQLAEERKGAPKIVQEYERSIEALRRELTTEQLAHKKTAGELADARYDKEFVVNAYKRLQGRYGLLQKENETMQKDNFTLKRDTLALATLKQTEAELNNRIARLQESLQKAHSEVDALKLAKAEKERELVIAEQKITSAEGSSKADKDHAAQLINKLKQELANCFDTVQKQSSVIEHLKSRLANSLSGGDGSGGPSQQQQQQQQGDMGGTSNAKGRRCPCKSRPPPPARWNN